jgi:mono/diheme cytochrome c family protein
VWICAHCADALEAAVAYQVTNGKNAMPAFGGKLSEGDIADVGAYVIDQPRPGVVFCLASALAAAGFFAV